MTGLIEKFESIIVEYADKLSALPVGSLEDKLPGKWSKKEILGHLIDSANNNHSRIVRALFEEVTVEPYRQNLWVKVQHYQDEDFNLMVMLWKSYNLHLVHILKNIRAEDLNTFLRLTDSTTVTLAWLIEDYVNHLVHHLAQIVTE